MNSKKINNKWIDHMNLRDKNKGKLESYLQEDWWNTCKDFHRWFVNPCQNFYRALEFAKRGWCDRDWDNAYFEDIVIWKLKRMSKHFKEHAWHEDYLQTVGQIDKVVELLERHRKDEYEEEETKGIDEKYGELRMYSPSFRDGEKSVRVLMQRDKEDATNTKRIRSEVLKAYKRAEKRRKKDLHDAFNLIEQHLEGWWD